MNDNPEDWRWVGGFEKGIDSTNIASVQTAHYLGLQPQDLAIFEAIHYDYGQVECRESLAHRSFGLQNPAMSEAAVERCFREGWIHVVTPEFERELREELRAGGYIQAAGLFNHEMLREIQGESVAGIISFTRSGAQLWKQWLGESQYGHWVIGYDEVGLPAAFGTTIDAVKLAYEGIWEDASFDHPFSRGAITAVGPWCDCWWRQFQSGFKLTYSRVSITELQNGQH